jgi:hypothetical protein
VKTATEHSATRFGLLVLFWLVVSIYSTYLIFNPADTPTFLNELDAWSDAHRLAAAGIAVLIFVASFVWLWVKSVIQTETALDAIKEQLDSIAKDLAELKRK